MEVPWNTMSILLAAWQGRGTQMNQKYQIISSISCSVFSRPRDPAASRVGVLLCCHRNTINDSNAILVITLRGQAWAPHFQGGVTCLPRVAVQRCGDPQQIIGAVPQTPLLLWGRNMGHGICAIEHGPYTMFFNPYTIFYGPYTNVLWSIYQCPMVHMPCSIVHIQCSMVHIPCSVLYIGCTVTHIPCFIVHIPCPIRPHGPSP